MPLLPLSKPSRREAADNPPSQVIPVAPALPNHCRGPPRLSQPSSPPPSTAASATLAAPPPGPPPAASLAAAASSALALPVRAAADPVRAFAGVPNPNKFLATIPPTALAPPAAATPPPSIISALNASGFSLIHLSSFSSWVVMGLSAVVKSSFHAEINIKPNTNYRPRKSGLICNHLVVEAESIYQFLRLFLESF